MQKHKSCLVIFWLLIWNNHWKHPHSVQALNPSVWRGCESSSWSWRRATGLTGQGGSQLEKVRSQWHRKQRLSQSASAKPPPCIPENHLPPKKCSELTNMVAIKSQSGLLHKFQPCVWAPRLVFYSLSYHGPKPSGVKYGRVKFDFLALCARSFFFFLLPFIQKMNVSCRRRFFQQEETRRDEWWNILFYFLPFVSFVL